MLTLKEDRMKLHKLLLVRSSCSCTSLGLAKDKAESDVTGCLAKGDNAKEFVLKGNDGSTWEVRGTKSSADHVGHTVTATGVVSSPTMHNMKEDAKMLPRTAG